MSPNTLRLATQSLAPASSPARAPHARRCTVRVETESGVLVGKVYIAHGRGRVSDVLSDERPFLNLTDVTSAEGAAPEPFVAVNKRHILTLRVLDEGRPGPTEA